MKFESSFASAQTLPLVSAILIYKGDTENTHRGDAMATVHRIMRDENGTARIGPGKLPSPRAMRQLASDLFSSSSLSYLPPNVLAFSFQRIVWYQPSCLRRIWFGKDIDSKRLSALNGKLARWPALLFSATNRLAVFALATSDRPAPITPLYRAPFPNVEGQRGGVALCSAHPPGSAGLDTMAAWERSFYDTEFTHSATGLIHGDYEALWESMTDKTAQPDTFPKAALKPIKPTHGDAEGRGRQSTLQSYLKSESL